MNSLFYYKYKKGRWADASILYEVPCQKRNEGYQEHNYEEPQAGHSRCVSRMWDQDVQNREKLKLILRVAESLEGWVSLHKDTQLFVTNYIKGWGYAHPQQKSSPDCLLEFNLMSLIPIMVLL